MGGYGFEGLCGDFDVSDGVWSCRVLSSLV